MFKRRSFLRPEVRVVRTNLPCRKTFVLSEPQAKVCVSEKTIVNRSFQDSGEPHDFREILPLCLSGRGSNYATRKKRQFGCAHAHDDPRVWGSDEAARRVESGTAAGGGGFWFV